MVSLPSVPLTKIGFRKDVKLFLAFLVGFLISLILVLLTLLQATVLEMRDGSFEQWNVIADVAAATLTTTPGDIATVETLGSVRSPYHLPAIDFVAMRGQHIRSGIPSIEDEVLTRQVPGGTAVFHFDASRLHTTQTRFRLTAIITIVATIAGTVLLLLYMPKIVRPIEELLDYAKEVGERHADEDETFYLIETFRDTIATLKLQESELKRLHDAEKLRADELELVTATLTRSMSAGFIAIDDGGRVVDINSSGREILGLPTDRDVRRAPIADLGPGELARILAETVASGATVTRLEIEDHAENGATTFIGLSTVPLVSEDGRYLGMLALFTDLSLVRGLEARLREVQTLAELGEISAGIAHELRNSLSTILGYLRLARRHGISDEAEARLKSAEEEAALLSRAVDGLLSFARPMTIERHPVDVMQIARDVAERLSPLTADIEFRIEGPPLGLTGDASLLSRAIENLLRNAIEAIRQRGGAGSVVITSAEGSPPTLEIRDDGIGFDPAHAARLLLPFQSDKPGGLGLGLPLARKIVILHGGTMRLTGVPGGGATVRISW